MSALLSNITVDDEADVALRHTESEFYRLFRRVFIAQKNGDYDLGDKFQQIMTEDGEPRTEADLDERMAKALKVMGPI